MDTPWASSGLVVRLSSRGAAVAHGGAVPSGVIGAGALAVAAAALLAAGSSSARKRSANDLEGL
jgi:hypothetical protein